jgi:hypothetical protein
MKIRARQIAGGAKCQKWLSCKEEKNRMVINVNLVLVTIVIFMHSIIPSVYAGYKLDSEDGKSGSGRIRRVKFSL